MPGEHLEPVYKSSRQRSGLRDIRVSLLNYPLHLGQEFKSMPNDPSGDGNAAEPNKQATTQPPSHLPGSQGQTSNAGRDNTNDDNGSTAQLERDIRMGEKWVIGLQAFTLLVGIIVAYIYNRQLDQMIAATQAAQKSVEVAVDSLETSQSQFDRTMSQTIPQTAAEIQSARTEQETLRMSQRPWVSAKSFDPIRLTVPPKGRFDLYGKVTLVNTGTSTATNGDYLIFAFPNEITRMQTEWDNPCQWIHKMKNSEKMAERKTPMPWPKGVVLAPGQSNHYGITMGMDATPREIAQGFFLAGCITYWDQFNLQHTTRFCFQPDQSVTSDTNPKDLKFDPCGIFESAD